MKDAAAVKLVDKLMAIHAALADPDLLKIDVTVLAILIEATNKTHGYAWASIPTIARVTMISERYARQVIRKLEKIGYVRVVLGGRGPKSTNRYFPNVRGGTSSSPDTSYIPSYIKNPSVPTAPQQAAAPPVNAGQKSLQEEEPNIAAKLRIIERTIKTGKITAHQSADWSHWLEVIADVYEAQKTGDRLGGWAYRLLDELGAYA